MKLGPVTIISTKQYTQLERDNEALMQVRNFVTDTFGSIMQAQRVLFTASELADSFRLKQDMLQKDTARLKSKYCEYTGILKGNCYCGNHGR